MSMSVHAFLKYLFFQVFLFISIVSVAQNSEYYFNDTEGKEGNRIYTHIRYNNTVITGGYNLGETLGNGAIMCLDTTGNIVWNTTTNDTIQSIVVLKLMLGSDGFLYAYSYGYYYSTLIHGLWKVDPSNGSVLWKKKMSYADDQIRFLVDYDSSKLIVSYLKNRQMKFAFVSKSTGDTTSTHFISHTITSENRHALAVDNNKNIYYTHNDTITKVLGSNPDSIVWKKVDKSIKMWDYYHIICDSSTASMYIFCKNIGALNYNAILKVDVLGGSVKTVHSTSVYGADMRDIKIIDNIIYIAWGYVGVGGNIKEFWYTKYDMFLGTGIWSWHYNFGGNEEPLSIDVDSAGDIFLTGVYLDDNWGILKANGQTGVPIYTKRVALDTSILDKRSKGLGVYIIDNKLYFIGQLQTDHHGYGRIAPALVKLENSSGNILSKKLIYGENQFASSTIDIEKCGENKTVVLKQVGRSLEVEMGDSTRTILWKKILTKDYYLFSKLIYISPLNNDIFIPAYSSHEEPSGIYTDSIHLFRLDDQGLLLNEHTFSVRDYFSYPVEFYEDSNSFMLFYSKGNTLRYRKITSSSVSVEYDTKVKYYPVPTETKYCINKNDSILLMFGEGSAASGMFKLNKNTHALSSVSGHNGAINYALELDTHRVVLCTNGDIGNETISLYNHEQKKVVWTKYISFSGNIFKCITDPQKNFIYSIGIFKTYIPSNIIIRKYNIQDGAISWEYVYNGTANLDDYPLDIAYDSIRNEIIVTGYETYNYEKRVLILVLDTSGKRMNRIIRGGDFAGDNTGNCVHVFSDGTRWVGGNLNKNPHGLAGFIFEVGPCSTKYSTISPVTCGGYITPSGKYINKSGIYSDTVSTIQGCDSVITINLVIKTTSKNTIAVSSCRAYISPSGKYTWTVNGKFYDTIPTIYGCDSILTINLTIKTFVQSTINVGACKSYTSPSGKYIWTASGKYYDTVFSASNCDSIFTINLTISTYQTITKSDTACNIYYSPSGKYMWTASGTYHDTIFSAGCDSVFTVHLTVNNSSSDSINPIWCTDYTSPSGKYTWTTSGIYLDTIPTKSGCDSIITVNLTIGLVNTGVTVNNNILTANATNAHYQWMDCNTNSIINADTNQQFIPTTNGNYAVIITENSCTDTSACYLITNVSAGEILVENGVNIFPNPSKGIYKITSNTTLNHATLKVYNSLGEEVFNLDGIAAAEFDLDLSKVSAGVYSLIM